MVSFFGLLGGRGFGVVKGVGDLGGYSQTRAKSGNCTRVEFLDAKAADVQSSKQ
jgi:hypothetical protein